MSRYKRRGYNYPTLCMYIALLGLLILYGIVVFGGEPIGDYFPRAILPEDYIRRPVDKQVDSDGHSRWLTWRESLELRLKGIRLAFKNNAGERYIRGLESMVAELQENNDEKLRRLTILETMLIRDKLNLNDPRIYPTGTVENDRLWYQSFSSF